MRALVLSCLGILLLTNCESRQSTATTHDEPTSNPEKIIIANPLAAKVDTADISWSHYSSERGKALSDTSISLGSRHYQLRMSAQMDSSQQIGSKRWELPPAPSDSLIAAAAQEPDIKYFNAKYTIAFTDSTGHQVFRRTFTKPAFYQPMSKELVMESFAIAPEFIGYNRPNAESMIIIPREARS